MVRRPGAQFNDVSDPECPTMNVSNRLRLHADIAPERILLLLCAGRYYYCVLDGYYYYCVLDIIICRLCIALGNMSYKKKLDSTNNQEQFLAAVEDFC